MALNQDSNSKQGIDYSVNHLILNLDLAGILFAAACSNYYEGEKHYITLQSQIDKLNFEIQNNKLKSGEISEDFKISMYAKLRELELFYEPVIRCFSITKMLLVNSAEAFINEVASCELKGKVFNEYDKLSLVGKWYFIPTILNLEKRFSLDNNPLQGLAALVKERNKLVHFKGARVSLNTPDLPNYLENFSLTPLSCIGNIQNVKTIIKDLFDSWIGSSGPDWLNALTEDEFRRPCFYGISRNCAQYLVSPNIDPERQSHLNKDE